MLTGERLREPGDLADNFDKALLAVLVLSYVGVALVEIIFLEYGVKITPNSFRIQMITLGGDAELELVDSLDPFSEGVVFSVRPPKKSWKNIANLSGGEKVFSNLAAMSECSVCLKTLNGQGWHPEIIVPSCRFHIILPFQTEST